MPALSYLISRHNFTAASHSSSRTRSIQPHARRDLDDLLMPPLHRAIALVQMHHVAVPVAENLHLDVFRARNVAFEKHRRIAERAARLALRLVEQIRRDRRACDDAHPAPAAAERRLDDERETDFLRRS